MLHARHLLRLAPRRIGLVAAAVPRQIRLLSSHIRMSPQIDRSLHVLPNDTPVVLLDCRDSFASLSDQEKLYAHHIARASFEGSLAVYLQVSPEAAGIFVVLYRLFAGEPLSALKEKALANGWSAEEWQSFLVYAAGLHNNSGNYKGFGDSKFVPGVDVEKLNKLIDASAAATIYPGLRDVWKAVGPLICSLEPSQLQLGFAPGGVTTYHSENITKHDADLVDRCLKARNFETWNTRLFKDSQQRDGKTVYRVVVASAETDGNGLEEVEFEGAIVKFERGDYSQVMARIVPHLKKASEAAANDTQRQMLAKYVAHFTRGALDDHKDGSRQWIKDVNPAVESYIGFIENYRDPAGTRSEFEGFVAAVNKETSKKFKALVDQAEKILERMPWGKAYEKDRFLRPDFTGLDVIAFGSSGIPAGINIPNYDDIRQDEGFKNVSLGNVISATPKQKMNFLDEGDEDLMFKYHKDSFEVQVGLHELLGHGSGKLFQRKPDGSFNFDTSATVSVLDGAKISTWYEPGETWGSKFGALSGAYEECRAEAVGYVLCCDEDILKIFGYEGELGQQVKYVNWLSEIRAGLMALEFYNADQKKWGQAHCHARYVLTQVCLEAGQGFVVIESITGPDGKPDLKFKLDRTKIDSVGKPAVREFLKKLQHYKSTADFAGGKALFDHYGKIGDVELAWRDVCIARRKPRRQFVQPNTILGPDGKVSLKSYAETVEGVVESFVDRYSIDAIEDLEKCWSAQKKWWPNAFAN
ncbi:unnamed protein product, partial [Mesorhabditis spiculigera]